MNRLRILEDAVQNHSILPFVYCYPPRTAYVAAEIPSSLLDAWAVDGETSSDLNIYIHIPFCRYRCSFCGLYTVTARKDDESLFVAYVSALRRELQSLSAVLRGRRVRTVFIGGGTPLLIGTHHLVSILTMLGDVFPRWRLTAEEVSIEASPDSVLSVGDQLHALVAAGVNRVSIGVQSFDDQELSLAGRGAAPGDSAELALRMLQDAGIKNVAADLIVGLEGQSDESFESSLQRLLSIRPQTISVYLINLRLNTPLGKRTDRSDSETNARLYCRLAYASAQLRTAGYLREGNVQFKLPGVGGLRQKQLYFSGVPVLGLGAGARSHTHAVDYSSGGGSKRTMQEIKSYLSVDRPEQNLRAGVRITHDEAIRRKIMFSLGDLDLTSIPRDGRGLFLEPYDLALRSAIEMGLLLSDGRRASLTEQGYLFRDLICWSLFSEDVLQRHASAGHGFPRQQRFVSTT